MICYLCGEAPIEKTVDEIISEKIIIRDIIHALDMNKAVDMSHMIEGRSFFINLSLKYGMSSGRQMFNHARNNRDIRLRVRSDGSDTTVNSLPSRYRVNRTEPIIERVDSFESVSL